MLQQLYLKFYTYSVCTVNYHASAYHRVSAHLSYFHIKEMGANQVLYGIM